MNGKESPIIENQTWRTTGGMKPLPLIALLFWSFSQARGTEDNDTFLLAEEFRLNGTSTQKAFGKAHEQALSTTVRLTRTTS